jgi:photosystem II stability/assembly factor-like uncharacterized protein
MRCLWPALFLIGACGRGPDLQEPGRAPATVILDSGCDVSLRGLSAASGGVVWASGSGGTVLRSRNRGAAWSNVAVAGAESLDFRDVQAFDAERALVVSAGSPAVIYLTEDGGRTWRETCRDPREGAFFDAAAFWDGSAGIVFSDPVDGEFLVIRTADGGETWSRIPPRCLPVPIEGEAGFAASGSCAAVYGDGRAWIGTGGSAARVLFSRDRGLTWASAETPLLHGTASQGIFSLAFWDNRHGIAVGGDYRAPELREGTAALTEDGGLTWFVPAGAGPGGFRSAVAFRPGSPGPELLCVGTGGVDYSPDGGNTWVPLSGSGFHALAFAPDGSSAWAAGGDGRIARFDFETRR